DKTVGLWSAALPRVFATRTLPVPAGSGSIVAVSPDGKRIAAVGEKYAVQVLDAETGSVISTLRGHRATIVHLVFSPDGSRLVSSGRDRIGYLWDVATGKRLAALDGHRGVIRSAAFSPDGRHLVSGGADKRILVYDLPPG